MRRKVPAAVSRGEAAQLLAPLSVTEHRIAAWIRRGVVADPRGAQHGKGHTRAFGVDDLTAIALVAFLVDRRGLSPRKVADVTKRVQRGELLRLHVVGGEIRELSAEEAQRSGDDALNLDAAADHLRRAIVEALVERSAQRPAQVVA